MRSVNDLRARLGMNNTKRKTSMKKTGLALLLASLLMGCGANGDSSSAAAIGAKTSLLAATLQFFTGGAEVKTYAAARLLDHASFGPTDAAIADVKARGIEGWIDHQFVLPASQIDASFTEDWDSNTTPGVLGRPYYELFPRAFMALMLSGDDQLRLRTTFALSQFIVITDAKIQSFGTTQYFNLLQDHAFGNFADLLRAVATSPSMGVFLDNNQNKKEGVCDSCSINENFARELMQLFTLGVTRLNKDGSVQRDAAGKLIETYTQDDVQGMARALTGWDTVWNPLGKRNGFYRLPMVAQWVDSHDTGEKKLLGKTIAAGGTAEQDLDSVIAILMAHPNIAPHLSLRMIQHLVTSDPSPAYLSRVASVFENNGSGVRGDMKALVRAILLDPEARRGDDASVQERTIGKVREPVLHFSAKLRGIQCRTALSDSSGNMYGVNNQQPFNATSVFSFYSPTYRAAGSNLLAPEQKLLISQEFSARLGGLSWIANSVPQNLSSAGCKLDEFVTALATSKRAFLNLASARYFRGSMPPPLRDSAESLVDQLSWMGPTEKAATMIQFLLFSPAFGVIK